MTDRRFRVALTAVLLLAATLRMSFPTADPPWRSTVGIVWHDEGAWTHNARNKALFGAWRQDDWNPIYIAPVFTGLEYASFAAFGVGLRQARLVSELAGLVSVLLLALGVRRIGGNFAGAIAGALLATNYVYVMYDRAAIMESLMTAFMVASWYGVTRADRRPVFGAVAGACATLAFFTKASAAAYVAALALTAVARWVPPKGGSYRNREGNDAPDTEDPVASAFRRNSLTIFAGLAGSFGLIAALFVLPHWTDYRFYNWQMSVTRKPSYDIAAILTRVTWFPIVHDAFSRMWVALALGLAGAWGVAVRWRRSTDAERLLVLWLAIGILEMLIHDTGNERRYVFLIPAIVALASLVLARGTLLPDEAGAVTRRQVLFATPVLLYTAYVFLGPVIRLPFRAQIIDPDHRVLKIPVRLSAVAAVVLTAAVVASWPRLAAAARAWTWRPALLAGVLSLAIAWNVGQFVDWAAHRTYKNYDAMLALGRALPPETLVQGKLANGLALENRIRPIFIGHEFGNYEDRLRRDDVRYILTYTSPRIGYEGSQIKDVLDASPGWRAIMTFDVAESPAGNDTAALIDKRARD